MILLFYVYRETMPLLFFTLHLLCTCFALIALFQFAILLQSHSLLFEQCIAPYLSLSAFIHCLYHLIFLNIFFFLIFILPSMCPFGILAYITLNFEGLDVHPVRFVVSYPLRQLFWRQDISSSFCVARTSKSTAMFLH